MATSFSTIISHCFAICPCFFHPCQFWEERDKSSQPKQQAQLTDSHAFAGAPPRGTIRPWAEYPKASNIYTGPGPEPEDSVQNAMLCLALHHCLHGKALGTRGVIVNANANDAQPAVGCYAQSSVCSK